MQCFAEVSWRTPPGQVNPDGTDGDCVHAEQAAADQGPGQEEAMAAMDVGPLHMVGATYENPLGRASMTAPTPMQLERASVVRMRAPARTCFVFRAHPPTGPAAKCLLQLAGQPRLRSFASRCKLQRERRC